MRHLGCLWIRAIQIPFWESNWLKQAAEDTLQSETPACIFWAAAEITFVFNSSVTPTPHLPPLFCIVPSPHASVLSILFARCNVRMAVYLHRLDCAVQVDFDTDYRWTKLRPWRNWKRPALPWRKLKPLCRPSSQPTLPLCVSWPSLLTSSCASWMPASCSSSDALTPWSRTLNGLASNHPGMRPSRWWMLPTSSALCSASRRYGSSLHL